MKNKLLLVKLKFLFFNVNRWELFRNVWWHDTSHPYQFLFLGRLCSRVLNSLNKKRQALYTEEWILLPHTDFMNKRTDNGNVSWPCRCKYEVSYVPNIAANCISPHLLFLSLLTTLTTRTVSDAYITSNLFSPSSVRERKINTYVYMYIYIHMYNPL